MKITNEHLVTDQWEIDKWDQYFVEENKKLDTKIYSSVLEERLRTNKIIKSFRIKKTVEPVWPVFIQQLVQDLNPSIKLFEIKTAGYYRSQNNIVFKVLEYKIHESFCIQWFANKQRINRNILVSHNSKSTKITYVDITKGPTSVQGYFERRIKNVYVKRQRSAFKVQKLKLKIALGLIPDRKISWVQLKIDKILKRSADKY
ncbi:MAG: hypothetical protein LBP70_01155 [Mycoplasmataceae bacterium]|jgi:hypothetical protein|nr:hypothetical protein [Mycoplasmataceae bacterium]